MSTLTPRSRWRKLQNMFICILPLFKKSTGSSFKEYLNMVRIEESKRLLSNTDFSIIDIAIAVGFEDQSYFSKVFKKFTGLTPKQFR